MEPNALTIQFLTQYMLLSEGVRTVSFIAVLIYLYYLNPKVSKDREEKLMMLLSESISQNSKVALLLDHIEGRLEQLSKDVAN